MSEFEEIKEGLLDAIGKTVKTPRLIRNALMTPDGTVIESQHRHDYVAYRDKNGKTYMVDGGLDYLRRSCNGDEVDLSLTDEQPHVVQREHLTWGSLGKYGDQPLRRIKIKDMETEHIKAVLKLKDENHLYKSWSLDPLLKTCMENELEFRIA